MNVFMIGLGSMGDTLPFVTIGQEMARRGHQVTFLGNEHFRDFILKRGLGFETVITKESYQAFVDAQMSQSRIASLRQMGFMLMETFQRTVDLLEERYVPGQTVACAQAYAMGARIAQEKFGLPLATAHLQPQWFRSLHSMPPIDYWPMFLKRGVQSILDFFIDKRVGKSVMDIRATFGKPRVKGTMRKWWVSPTCHFGLFPDWFAPPQPDWPKNVVLPGFPLPKESFEKFDMSEVNAFLEAGEPPLVFTQSSLSKEAHEYFATSIDIAQRTRSRAIFLTPHPELLPSTIPDGMRYFPYVPLEHLLSRAKAHLHHGGIGTIAHTLKAGIPQITVPMVYDQPDNSLRLEPLKVSINLKPSQYRAAKIAPRLAELVGSDQVQARCKDYAQRIERSDPLGTMADTLERLAEGKPIVSIT
ncbi:glycosyltransferase [bacterium]|nr:glycosyltransferase [bacterium]